MEQGLIYQMWFTSRPVTIPNCDAVIATGDRGEVFLNGVLATLDRCWVAVHIAAEVSGSYDAFHDLQTWNEESLIDFRSEVVGSYDLQLSIDGEPAELEFGRGNGGGVDDERQLLHWTQHLTFRIRPSQRTAILGLDWGALRLRGSHRLDLTYILRTVAASSY